MNSRFLGNLKGLELLVVNASKHPRWANPFTAVEYHNSTAGEIGPYYDSLQRQHGGELPYVFNPEELECEDEF